MESSWTPHELRIVHTKSSWTPHKVLINSMWSPHGVHGESMESPQSLHRLHVDSLGLHVDSMDSSWTPCGLSTDSSQTPYIVSIDSYIFCIYIRPPGSNMVSVCPILNRLSQNLANLHDLVGLSQSWLWARSQVIQKACIWCCHNCDQYFGNIWYRMKI